MTKHIFLAAVASLAAPLFAQDAPDGSPSPNEIVEQADAEEWVQIAPEDLLVMTLAPDAEGNVREVVIQLMPAPFSKGWVDNIRLLTRSGWYDDISVNRVQDNYVVQWGDSNYDNPEAEGEAKPLPDGLKVMEERGYSTNDLGSALAMNDFAVTPDPYAELSFFNQGWPVAAEAERTWPVHCYGMVGVGRGYSPDTGSGAELYTVIGHAPRHLDRNIALVGRVIEGIEHLSGLPRGKGALGFYEDPAKRTPILTVRVASDLPEAQQPLFEYLATEGETFARYAEARANRRDPFFIVPAGGADICNIPVPIRRTALSE
ncbi:peptidylprolyl isomerase [Qipengyuania atrilutea]|uniref:Peptidylprolyl isomerase n=1 Tax=Qipengyuania atrilutea TaxID=2744473 RepID=A0A850H1E9_9SPHN|nr:peptidylprolyl isomerase [Actirhodobacter atriluteus]NVD45771.1 peptidylprolyl isomerase [Actirhodobacter atriluteus]